MQGAGEVHKSNLNLQPFKSSKMFPVLLSHHFWNCNHLVRTKFSGRSKLSTSYLDRLRPRLRLTPRKP